MRFFILLLLALFSTSASAYDISLVGGTDSLEIQEQREVNFGRAGIGYFFMQNSDTEGVGTRLIVAPRPYYEDGISLDIPLSAAGSIYDTTPTCPPEEHICTTVGSSLMYRAALRAQVEISSFHLGTSYGKRWVHNNSIGADIPNSLEGPVATFFIGLTFE